MVLGREILHREQAAFRVLAEDARNGALEPARDRAHPCRLRRVALDRRLPQGLNLEPGQRALDAETQLAGLDEANVRRDAAGKRREAGDLSGLQEAHMAQGLAEIAALNERLLLFAHGCDARVSVN